MRKRIIDAHPNERPNWYDLDSQSDQIPNSRTADNGR